MENTMENMPENTPENAMENTPENQKEFHIHSVYDHKALKVMSRCLRKTMRFKLNLVTRIFGWTVLVLFTLFQILLALFGMFLLDVDTFFFLLVIAVMLICLLFEDDLNAWIAAWNLVPGTAEADSVFLPAEYNVTTQSAQTQWHYDGILAVCETPEYYLFFLSKRHAQLFPKDGFTMGTPDDFRKFITETTGKTFKTFKK